MFKKFLDTGKVPTKDNFTVATVAYLEGFWRDVCAALAEPVAPNSDVKNDAFDKLQFEHPLYHGINPGLADIYRTKDWNRVCKMFGDLKRKYRKVLALSTKSGTNNPDMANYVNGQASVLYLHYWVKERPNALEFVDGRIIISQSFLGHECAKELQCCRQSGKQSVSNASTQGEV